MSAQAPQTTSNGTASRPQEWAISGPTVDLLNVTLKLAVVGLSVYITDTAYRWWREASEPKPPCNRNGR